MFFPFSCSTVSLNSPSEDAKIQKNFNKKFPESSSTNSPRTSSKIQNNHIGNVYANIKNQQSGKFNGEKNQKDNLRLTENPGNVCESASHFDPNTTPRHHMYRPTTLHYNTYKPPSSRPIFVRDPSENNYATISGNSKRLVPHLKTANV